MKTFITCWFREAQLRHYFLICLFFNMLLKFFSRRIRERVNGYNLIKYYP